MSRTLRSNGNIYMKARLKAANFNDKLKSREGASEILGVSPSSLLNYEKDVCKQIPTDVVVKMAEIYNAPELMNYYCCNECPIGKNTVPHLELTDIGYLAIQISVSLKNPESMIDRLMEIVQDGIISKNEKPELKSIVGKLDGFSEKVQSLKLWAQKNLR
ncbi:helix-turn-helix domain-containing protein [Clostridium luticellarii]|uniref:HTH cro/C1-type domain-containing protein n=1 Tax=Clostridium luticellarii TaxID=1691940 RepID=A0A2T0BQ46_9CLOT|nr:helix-turn-helix transcriptional regulator [Clostridium luticellarii]PRR86006.1 hypothetical protein CLLU_10340 [Clostridium luticellarii]